MDKREKIREQFSAYIDGELSEPQTLIVAEAVAADAQLAAELESLRAVSNLVASLPREHAPEEMLAGILQQTERSHLVDASPPPSGPSAFRWVRRFAIAAVLAIAACIGVVIVAQLWTAEDSPQPQPRLAGGNDKDKINQIERPGRKSKSSGDGLKTNKGYKSKGGSISDGYVKDMLGLELALANAPVENVDIYTADMSDAQRSVEKVLGANGIEPAVLYEDGRVSQSRTYQGKRRSRGASYHSNRLSTKQVQYVVYVTDEQLNEIKKQLTPVIARQNVSQTPLRPAAAKVGDERLAVNDRRSGGGGGYKYEEKNGYGRTRSPRGGGADINDAVKILDKDDEKSRVSKALRENAQPARPLAKPASELKEVEDKAVERPTDIERAKRDVEQVEVKREHDVAGRLETAAETQPTKGERNELEERDKLKVASRSIRAGAKVTDAVSPRLASEGVAKLDKSEGGVAGAMTIPAAVESLARAGKSDVKEQAASRPVYGLEPDALTKLLDELFGVREARVAGPAAKPAASEMPGQLASQLTDWAAGQKQTRQPQQAATASGPNASQASGWYRAVQRRAQSGQRSNIWAHQDQLQGNNLATANVRKLLITVNGFSAADNVASQLASELRAASQAAQ